MVQIRSYADPLGDSSPGAAGDHAVQRPPSPVAGADPTRAGAEPAVGHVLVPSPCHLRQQVRVDAHLTGHGETPGQLSSGCASGTSKDSSCRGRSSHDSNITFILKHFPPFILQNQTKNPDSSKFSTSVKGGLPENMNPCRDFTFAIDFMREMLSYSDNI